MKHMRRRPHPDAPRRRLLRFARRLALTVGPLVLALTAVAATETPGPQAQPASAPGSTPNSALDAPLFYQLLIGEIELRAGEAGTAYQVILDAARRTGDEALFRRAVDIALGARAGEQALAAARAWRTAKPESLDALRVQLQILVAMNRPDELAEPMARLLALTPEAERAAALAAVPRFVQRLPDAKRVVQLVEQVAQPYRDQPATRVAARIALGRAWLAARDGARALVLAREAAALEPASPGPAALGIELMREQPAAESLVTGYLAQPAAEVELRLAYVRVLTDAQRYGDAIAQLAVATRQQPDEAAPWLTLGALQLELRHPDEGEAALRRYLQLAEREATGRAPAPDSEDAGDDAAPPPAERGIVQAWLMLAQAAEQRGDYAGAECWLQRIDDPQRALEVQTRRASILARQGRLAQARELVQRVPERRPEDARAKLLAEAGVLREAKQWQDAFTVLSGANRQFPDDSELLYEQAMLADKLGRLDEMEQLLRRVIELKPDNAHAYNALGYSLADRNRRLPEARTLVQRALELAPGDPFITDSLGWIEYRMGNHSEALRLLRTAWSARPDTEIGAHLGEVLWALDQKDEARRVWREARTRDAGNEVLRETLARLRVEL
ncbi:MAG: tetratricopeptide repeat protein [Rubrivivax sp.]